MAGGWYVSVAGRVSAVGPQVGIEPAVVVSSRQLALAGDQQGQYLALAEYSEDDRAGVFFGVRAFVDDAGFEPDALTFICGLEGEELELSVVVTDLETGESASATVPVVAALDPNDVAWCGS